ncbi:MAG: hypothetical protein Q4F97_09490 [Bacteroidales bacterium]|nr:hypothetical protein [Bacteroidales bacterium]
MSGCVCVQSDPDGLWDPIELEVEGAKLSSGHIITVDKIQSDFNFTLKSSNYKRLWITEISVDSLRIKEMENIPMIADTMSLECEWGNVVYIPSLISITLKPNDTSKTRIIDFGLECGDAFSYVRILQKGNF